MSRHKGHNYNSMPGRGGGIYGGGSSPGYCDAMSEEEVVLAVRVINKRTRRLYEESAEERAKAKVTLSPILNEWLKKEIE